MQKLEPHPITSIIPESMTSEEDFQALKASIEEVGQLEPITLYQGKILDGRNRYRACREMGIEAEWSNFEDLQAEMDITPIQFFTALNLCRSNHVDSVSAPT